jgi:hypothetical protein
MSNPSKTTQKKLTHSHNWAKDVHELKDGFEYYYMICSDCHSVKFPGVELQKLQDYAKKNTFMFVQDWVLLLLYAGHEYIAGITHYQKMLFLIYKEFIPNYDIPSENPGFYGYKYGPFSARIDEAIDFLIEYGYINTKGRKSTSKELFMITDKGKQRGQEIFKRLDINQQESVREFRKHWDQKTTNAILKYVYSQPSYANYLDKSRILGDLFPGIKLHRKRG